MDAPPKKRPIAAQSAARGPLREMPAELIEQLMQGPMAPSEVQDRFLSFQKAVVERAINVEMRHHNELNGASGKTAFTESGAMRIDVPPDRAGTFERMLIR